VGKGNDVITTNEVVIDSLENVISDQKSTIESFPSMIKKEKIKVHLEYDNYISKKDRGGQLMELHMIVKENLKELQTK
jgi:hypothetical protein